MIWLLAISLALLLFAAAIWAVRGNIASVKELPELSGRLQPVDLGAFKNLIEPSEADFLRRHLPPALFRKIQRQRALAALDYLGRATTNAAILLRLGEANRANPELAVGEAAAQLAAEALRTRLLAIPVRLLLVLEYVFPGHSPALSTILVQYERLTFRVRGLATLQSPQEASRVLSVL